MLRIDTEPRRRYIDSRRPQSASVGEPATFQVTALWEAPVLHYQWLRNGVDIPGRATSRIPSRP